MSDKPTKRVKRASKHVIKQIGYSQGALIALCEDGSLWATNPFRTPKYWEPLGEFEWGKPGNL